VFSDIDSYRLTDEPFYRAAGDEIALFAHAYAHGLPVILKGPTGCGKTRFIEHMAWKLKRPLITVACNEDMTASDLIGRYLLDGRCRPDRLCGARTHERVSGCRGVALDVPLSGSADALARVRRCIRVA